MIHSDEVLSLYDAEIRRDPVSYPGTRIEHDGPIVRMVGTENMILYSDLSDSTAEQAVVRQVAFFRHLGVEFEWKTYGHDRPKDLPAILQAEGFVPDQPETLVVYDLQDTPLRGELPPGTEIRPVTDLRRLEDAADATERAFGPDSRPFVLKFKDRLNDSTVALFVAYVDGLPASAGRVDLPPHQSFAGLFGGGTVPEHRHRGIYRGLVAARASLAKDRGYRYLTVDARATSLPILERLGFVPLTTMQGWVLRPISGGKHSLTDEPDQPT